MAVCICELCKPKKKAILSIVLILKSCVFVKSAGFIISKNLGKEVVKIRHGLYVCMLWVSG